MSGSEPQHADVGAAVILEAQLGEGGVVRRVVENAPGEGDAADLHSSGGNRGVAEVRTAIGWGCFNLPSGGAIPGRQRLFPRGPVDQRLRPPAAQDEPAVSFAKVDAPVGERLQVEPRRRCARRGDVVLAAAGEPERRERKRCKQGGCQRVGMSKAAALRASYPRVPASGKPRFPCSRGQPSRRGSLSSMCGRSRSKRPAVTCSR